MPVTINVALRRNGVQPPKHIFRTAEDSIGSVEAGIDICRSLSLIFPAWLYEITLWESRTTNHNLEWQPPAVASKAEQRRIDFQKGNKS